MAKNDFDPAQVFQLLPETPEESYSPGAYERYGKLVREHAVETSPVLKEKLFKQIGIMKLTYPQECANWERDTGR